MKKLSIKIDSYVMTECWTFYKLAIIQIHPNYLEWLAGRMGLFFADNCNCFFGDKCYRFSMEYFNDILRFEEINMCSFNSDNIIEIIKNELNKGNYIIFDCNYTAFDDDPDINENGIHEALLYGYDDEKKVMFTTCLMNGKFVESEFSYDSVKK